MAAADSLGRATGVSGPAKSERAKAGKIRIASILRSIFWDPRSGILQLAWQSIKPSWFTFFALRQTSETPALQEGSEGAAILIPPGAHFSLKRQGLDSFGGWRRYRLLDFLRHARWSDFFERPGGPAELRKAQVVF
jgi:hypothetical protein